MYYFNVALVSNYQQLQKVTYIISCMTASEAEQLLFRGQAETVSLFGARDIRFLLLSGITSPWVATACLFTFGSSSGCSSLPPLLLLS